MAVFYDFVMTGIVVLSVCMGWKHADEPFFDTARPKMPRRLKRRAFLLAIAGAAIMLAILFDPAASKARETFNSLSTVGFKILWLFLMGGLVIAFGLGQLALYDMVANYRIRHERGGENGRET